MPYRDDIEALEARHAALNQEIRERTSERDGLRHVLDSARAATVVATVRVASPCSADWNAMEGDDRVRYCATCSKSVYNLSSMTRTDAAALLLEREGKLCVRYFQRKDGTIMLQDCSVGVWKRRHRTIAALALAAGAGATTYGKLHEAPPAPSNYIEITMGETGRPGTYEAPDTPDIPDTDEPMTNVLGGLPDRR